MVRGNLSVTKQIVQSKGGQNAKYSHSFPVTILLSSFIWINYKTIISFRKILSGCLIISYVLIYSLRMPVGDSNV